MKKIAIAGASVALAAMPVVGVFAGTGDVLSQIDTIEITIDDHCSFGYTSSEQTPAINVTGVEHAGGLGTWGSDDNANKLSATMSTGTSSNDLGSTTLGIYCNNKDGYTITTSNAGALSGATSGESIAINEGFSSSTSGWSYIVAAGEAASQRGEVKNSHTTWATSANANGLIAGSTANAPKTTDNDGDFFTVTYGAGISESQAADTYTGSITYTLAAL